MTEKRSWELKDYYINELNCQARALDELLAPAENQIRGSEFTEKVRTHYLLQTELQTKLAFMDNYQSLVRRGGQPKFGLGLFNSGPSSGGTAAGRALGALIT